MITTKSPQEIEYMREAGRIVALAHEAIKPYLVEGTSTKQINDICETYERPAFCGKNVLVFAKLQKWGHSLLFISFLFTF